MSNNCRKLQKLAKSDLNTEVNENYNMLIKKMHYNKVVNSFKQ